MILNTGQINTLMIYLKTTIIIGDSLQHGFIVMICAGVSETDKIESHGLCNREKAKCYLPAFFLLLC